MRLLHLYPVPRVYVYSCTVYVHRVRVPRACTHADRVVRTFTMGVGHKGIYSHEDTVVLLQSCMYCVEGPHSRPFST